MDRLQTKKTYILYFRRRRIIYSIPHENRKQGKVTNS